VRQWTESPDWNQHVQIYQVAQNENGENGLITSPSRLQKMKDGRMVWPNLRGPIFRFRDADDQFLPKVRELLDLLGRDNLGFNPIEVKNFFQRQNIQEYRFCLLSHFCPFL